MKIDLSYYYIDFLDLQYIYIKKIAWTGLSGFKFDKRTQEKNSRKKLFFSFQNEQKMQSDYKNFFLEKKISGCCQSCAWTKYPVETAALCSSKYLSYLAYTTPALAYTPRDVQLLSSGRPPYPRPPCEPRK